MSYLVIVTFDLKAPTTERRHYDSAYEGLEQIGLRRDLPNSQGGNTRLTDTTVGGTFNGTSVEGVRDNIRARVSQAFTARGLKSDIFVFVGSNGTWGSTST